MHMNKLSSRPGLDPMRDSVASAAPSDFGEQPSRDGLLALRQACQASGGIVRGDELAHLLEDCRRGDFVSLARLIARRDIFAIEWQGSLWVPMFQFDLRDLSIRLAPQRVSAQLHAVRDGWTLATWFARPNGWLQGRRPLDLLDSQPDLVVCAARVERFVAARDPHPAFHDRRPP